MKRLVHISDLHFGRVDYRALGALESVINQQLRPDVIAVSGDLTQRAKRSQFEEASAFLAKLEGPKVVVPGNHDIPFYNLFERWIQPLARFRKFIGEPEPIFEKEELLIAGINTPKSLTIEGGKFSRRAFKRLSSVVVEATGLAEEKIKVILSHHPLDLLGSRSVSPQSKGWVSAREILSLSPDILLSGHQHRFHSAVSATVINDRHRSFIFVQSGTSSSTRHRGGTMSFNSLDVAPKSVRCVHWNWQSATKSFCPDSEQTFLLGINGWEIANKG